MISVIIATFNRSHLLKRVLESFFHQNGLDNLVYELIVVDNNSTDNTKIVFDRFLGYPTVRYVFEPKQGVSAARNRGARESKGEIIAFLDDDVVVDRNWLLNLDKCLSETNADVVGGRSYLIFEETPPEWLESDFRILLSEVNLGDERKLLTEGRRLFGLNLAIRKDLFLCKGGFSLTLGRMGYELTGGEETDLIGKIQGNGNIVVYDPSVRVSHIIDPTRTRWDYFLALADGFSKAKTRNEFPCGKFYQCLRLGRSAVRCGQTFFSLIKANIFAQSLYERKMAEYDFKKSRSHFRYRLNRL